MSFDGVKAICDSLKKNTALTKLCLGSEYTLEDWGNDKFLLMFLSTENEFGSDGIKAICEMLKGNKRIQEIQLWG